MLERTRKRNRTEITFVVPAEHPSAAYQVSVVGDFNDWTPGAHSLEVREDGSRAISVIFPAKQEIRFRYLGENGNWFDEEDARHDGRDCVLET